MRYTGLLLFVFLVLSMGSPIVEPVTRYSVTASKHGKRQLVNGIVELGNVDGKVGSSQRALAFRGVPGQRRSDDFVIRIGLGRMLQTDSLNDGPQPRTGTTRPIDLDHRCVLGHEQRGPGISSMRRDKNVRLRKERHHLGQRLIVFPAGHQVVHEHDVQWRIRPLPQMIDNFLRVHDPSPFGIASAIESHPQRVRRKRHRRLADPEVIESCVPVGQKSRTGDVEAELVADSVTRRAREDQALVAHQIRGLEPVHEKEIGLWSLAAEDPDLVHQSVAVHVMASLIHPGREAVHDEMIHGMRAGLVQRVLKSSDVRPNSVSEMVEHIAEVWQNVDGGAGHHRHIGREMICRLEPHAAIARRAVVAGPPFLVQSGNLRNVSSNLGLRHAHHHDGAVGPHAHIADRRQPELVHILILVDGGSESFAGWRLRADVADERDFVLERLVHRGLSTLR